MKKVDVTGLGICCSPWLDSSVDYPDYAMTVGSTAGQSTYRINQWMHK